MMYQNYPYAIFNPECLNYDRIHQIECQRQWEQNKNILDMVKAVSDYCEAARKVHPDYRQAALSACMLEILDQMAKDNGGRF